MYRRSTGLTPRCLTTSGQALIILDAVVPCPSTLHLALPTTPLPEIVVGLR